MKTLIVLAAACGLAAAPLPLLAQAQKQPATQYPDVIFVPTPQEVVEDMLRLANVQKGDVLYDLGSGAGRIAITAARPHRDPGGAQVRHQGYGYRHRPRAHSRGEREREEGGRHEPGPVPAGEPLHRRFPGRYGDYALPASRPQREAAA